MPDADEDEQPAAAGADRLAVDRTDALDTRWTTARTQSIVAEGRSRE